MAAGSWTLFHGAKEKLCDGTIDLDTHSFKVALLASTWTPNLATNAVWADISVNDLATANGYTAGGAALGTPTWTNSSGTMTFDAVDPEWTATGGSITARYAVIYDDTAASDDLLCYCLLDTAPADVTATTGNVFLIELHANGIFTLA